MDWSLCKGCKNYSNVWTDDLFVCTLEIAPVDGYGNNCPCIKCLIKGICISECEDFIKYDLESDQWTSHVKNV